MVLVAGWLAGGSSFWLCLSLTRHDPVITVNATCPLSPPAAEGRGFATFWVINHRQPLEFLYLRYPSVEVGIGQDFAWGNAQVLAGATLDIHPGLAKAPHQLRLSLLGFHLDIPGDG